MSAALAPPHRFCDQLGRRLRLPGAPQRIVSLVPSLTELLYDLGLGEAVVGVTKFCEHPPEARAVHARIGGTKTPALARILGLRPDLVIANQEENRAQDVAVLEAQTRVWVSDVRTAPQAFAMIRNLGAVVGRAARARALAGEIAGRFARLRTGPPRRVAYLIWRRPWMVAGSDTLIHDLLGRCGFINVFGHLPRYPQVDAAALAAAAPEVLLLASEPYPFKPAHVQELAAVLPGARAVQVDGQMFCWFGSRLGAAPAYFQNLMTQLAGRRP